MIDTNILVAANGDSPQASIECRIVCIENLTLVRDGRNLALDESGEIVAEYSRYCSYKGQPGVGDEFFRWVVDNQYTQCTLVSITPDPQRGFREFPDSADLVGFDKDDRKFVATALTCTPAAEILNALDSDWSLSNGALRAAGVEVRELCPDCLACDVAGTPA